MNPYIIRIFAPTCSYMLRLNDIRYNQMMRISHSVRRSCIGIFALLLLSLVGASAQVLRKPTYMDYIRTYQAEARRQMDRHAIPASITLAQG